MVAADDRHRLAPEVTRGAFPLIATFLRGYLHQDWAMDYESPQQARDVFLDDASSDERAEFVREAARLSTVLAHMPLGEVATLLLVFVALVALADRASALLRRWLD